MDITSYSQFRQNLKSFLDQVVANKKPLFVTRANGEEIVILSKSDYESLNETYYLLKSPKNAERLLNGIEEYKNELGKERNLIE